MAFFAFENVLFGLKKVGPPFTDIIRKIVFEGFFESETRRRETSEMKCCYQIQEEVGAFLELKGARRETVLLWKTRQDLQMYFPGRIISNIRGLVIYQRQ